MTVKAIPGQLEARKLFQIADCMIFFCYHVNNTYLCGLALAFSKNGKPRNSCRFDLASAPRPFVRLFQSCWYRWRGQNTHAEWEREEKLPFHVITIGRIARVVRRPIGEVWRIIHNCPETQRHSGIERD